MSRAEPEDVAAMCERLAAQPTILLSVEARAALEFGATEVRSLRRRLAKISDPGPDVLVRMARAVARRRGRTWNRMSEARRSQYIADMRVALAALEGSLKT